MPTGTGYKTLVFLGFMLLALGLVGCGNAPEPEPDATPVTELAQLDSPASTPTPAPTATGILASTPVPVQATKIPIPTAQPPDRSEKTGESPKPTPTPVATQLPDDGPGDKGHPKDDSGNNRNQVSNWRELYKIPYTISCMDARVGAETVRKFQTGERAPSTQEREAIKSCEMQRDGDTRAGDDKSDKADRGNGGSSRNQVGNWRELYQLPYKISCIDARLSTSVTRDFQTGKRAPTDAEMKILEGCNVESSDRQSSNERATNERVPQGDDIDDMDVRERIEDIKARSGGWTDTGNPLNDQYSVGYRPTADEWRCGVAAVGVDTLRAIKAGKHSITAEETQKLTPCFRASPDSITHPYAKLWEGHCIPVDLLLEVIDYYRPSWEQLECHLEGLERYEMPKNQVRYLMLGGPFGIRNNKTILYPQLWDRIMTDPYYEDLKLNFSPSQANIAMPPYYDEEYNSMKCHSSRIDDYGNRVLDDYWIEEALRGAAVGYIIEKKKGRRIFADVGRCSNAYVVQGDLADYGSLPISSVDDYKEVALNVVIPKVILQAQAAEKVKAEMMQVGGIQAEVEVIFSMNEFLGNLPPSEQVELAQWFIDKLIPEVKKHFKGMIWVTSAADYDSGDPNFPTTGMNPTFGPHWKDLSFAAADHVSFTLSLSCDFPHVERYLKIQFDNIREIVQRDNISWSDIGGDGLTAKRYFGPTFHKSCKDDLDEKKLEIHKLVLSYVEDFPTRPYFLPIPQPPRSWTKEDEGYSPTESDAGRGNWQLFSLDENEVPEEVRELWMAHARANVRN